MTDRCFFFEDLLEVPSARERSYVLLEPSSAGLVCLDAWLRVGSDWCFARKWVWVRDGRRELYRTMDRLEACGFRFHVQPRPPASNREEGSRMAPELRLRASQLQRELSTEEQRVHAELFPDELDWLRRGYDWDADHVYKRGIPLALDAFGRVLEEVEGVLYEWVAVPDEATWRRYPLQRLRTTTPKVRT